MPTLTDLSTPTHGYIMIVDNTPENPTLLEAMLIQDGYEVRSFPLGRHNGRRNCI
jgi:hypothetical protein